MDKSIITAVLGYTAKETLSSLLGEGIHTVTIRDYRPLDSFHEWNGDVKQRLPEFVDPAGELGVMFGNEEGIIFHRFHFEGYARWDELSDTEQADDKYEKVVFNGEAYACKYNKKGQLERIVSDQRTQRARALVDQFMAAVGMTGRTIGELGQVVAAETPLKIRVELDEYEGKSTPKINKFISASAKVETEDDDFSE